MDSFYCPGCGAQVLAGSEGCLRCGLTLSGSFWDEVQTSREGYLDAWKVIRVRAGETIKIVLTLEKR